MNARLSLAALILAVLTTAPLEAAKRKGADVPPVPATGMPSARLESLLQPCLDAVLAPLESDPKLPRVEVEKLRASFAAGQIKAKTPAQQQIYQNAMAVCDALTKAMDDRANAKSAALASAKVPAISSGGGIIKSSPIRGADAGANAEAIRKKQKDERKYADKEGAGRVAFMNSAAYRSWTERSAQMRRGVMMLYTRQVQLEALEERNAAIATQAAGAATAAEAAKAAKAAQDEAAARIAAAAEAAKAAAEEKVAKARAEAQAKAAAAKKAAKSAQAEAAAKAAAAEKAESVKLAAAKSLAKEAAYVGEWEVRSGNKSMKVNEDHTATRTTSSGEQTNGAWNIVDGLFRLHWEEGSGVKGQLSADGQVLEGGKGLQWFRKKSSEGSNTAAAPAAKTAKKELADESRLVGSWTIGAGGNSIVEIKNDHTATRTRRGSDPTKGTWTFGEDGHFEMKWEDGAAFRAKLSNDGQTLDSVTGKAHWSRKKP